MTCESWQYVCIYSLGFAPSSALARANMPAAFFSNIGDDKIFIASTVYGFRPRVWVTSGATSHSYFSGAS